MRRTFEKYFQELSKKTLICCLLITLAILIIRYLGLLKPLEFAYYDFLYHIRPEEQQDPRIVLVAWNEDDIRYFQEGNISDTNLVKILTIIKNQQPSVIGLDLYRDVPVPSFNSSLEKNQQAYWELNQIFSQTDNLVGITKVVPPSIAAPKSLQKDNRVTASDLIIDNDSTIRRAFLYPLGKDQWGKVSHHPSLGLSIAIKYLTDKNYFINPQKSNDSIVLENIQNNYYQEISSLQRLDGSYLRKEPGEKIIINWRKNKHPFLEISTSDIIKNTLSPNVFKDKIVIIGNTSISSSDRHQTSLNRWGKNHINGLEIHGHIASLIISGVIDSRPFIKSIPEWLEILSIFVVGITIIYVIETNSTQPPLKIFEIASLTGFSIILILSVVSIIGFDNSGLWIPTIPATISCIFTPGIACLVKYIERIQDSQDNFQKLIKNVNHSLQNYTSSLLSNLNMAHSLNRELIELEPENFLESLDEYELIKGEYPLDTIQRSLTKSQFFTQELKRQQQQLQDYLKLISRGKKLFRRVKTPLNSFIKETILHIEEKKTTQYNCYVDISESYDPRIQYILIERESFSRVIENLLDNAYFAIEKKVQDNDKHQGVIEITTKKTSNTISIEIVDNGIGINEKVIGYIFEPFFSTKSKNRSQGLGLFLVQETVDKHKGKITVLSEESKGTSFIITLPNSAT